jgi:hypothetical protein
MSALICVYDFGHKQSLAASTLIMQSRTRCGIIFSKVVIISHRAIVLFVFCFILFTYLVMEEEFTADPDSYRDAEEYTQRVSFIIYHSQLTCRSLSFYVVV